MSHASRCARFVAPLSFSLIGLLASVAIAPQAAQAQSGYVAAIAYSQETGKVGHSARQARTEQAAKSLALRACGAPDAKVWMWAQDQWVAIATADGLTGAAGFGRGKTAEEAQEKALDECAKRAHGVPCSVALCTHSSGARPRQLLKRDGDPELVAARRAGYVAAIAYSPKTGRVGSTAGVAKSKKEAHQLALKECASEDAKVYMWGPEWVAVATVEGRPGVAGFAPGATREIAERAALEQAQKLCSDGKCQVTLAIHAAGEPKAKTAAKPVAAPVSTTTEGPILPAGN
ncbi:DUF4189 domain-containing protein [Lacipirellula parvula]|uniref:DUF4189 domain-containing protein n=1 Tax=Lacipirellula parvula TaxID=2650471 RepID=A0A5K7XFR6_9BACT|nr:DUF4189 domain-containing protein [Lacipirellula parvula]BBO34887.1 hypothetical protein PLANPX_4499 [Lacipirellula parvula]